jgi:hypothetical protein
MTLVTCSVRHASLSSLDPDGRHAVRPVIDFLVQALRHRAGGRGCPNRLRRLLWWSVVARPCQCQPPQPHALGV